MVYVWRKLAEFAITVGHRHLLRRRFRLRDGSVQDFEVATGRPIVCIFPVTRDGLIILARQFRPGPERVLSELPGGTSIAGESESRAAARELLEETGYKGRLQLMGVTYAGAYDTSRRYHFIARNCIRVREPMCCPAEEIELDEVSLDEFHQRLISGELTDTTTGFWALAELGYRPSSPNHVSRVGRCPAE